MIQVSQITKAMKDKWDQSGDDKKYLQSMESSWDVMRPLYISMLKVFLEKCSDEDVKKLNNKVNTALQQLNM